MPVTCLYTMGALAVLLLGMFNGFVAQMLPVRATPDAPLLAIARLQYVLIGTSMMLIVAVLYQWAAATARTQADDTLGRLSFWMVFLGFNAAFFPTALRRAPVLLSDPGRVLSGTVGPEVLIGALTFSLGMIVCMWDLVRVRHPVRN